MRIRTIVEEENVTPRTHGRIMRQVNHDLAVRHRNKRVAKHFQRNKETNPVSGGYGYRRRSERTKAIKRRLGADPLRPNYVTGRMFAAIRASSRVTRTQHQWSWIARNPEFALADWRREEIEAISRAEVSEDTSLMGRRYVILARRPENQRKRRRRAG